MFYKG